MALDVFLPTGHEAHAPQHEMSQGSITPYMEVPARVERIQQGVAAHPGVRLQAHPTPLPGAALVEVHTPELVAHLQATSQRAAAAGHYLYPQVFPMTRTAHALQGNFAFDADAPIGAGTWQAAHSSASAAWAAAEKVRMGHTTLSYALCRPPGHHAGRGFVGGYCYLNNAAIAAAHLKTLDRGAILDVDYHHGNGTQQIFWEDETVFFASLHADPAFAYPHYAGYASERGDGTTLNVPLPAGTDDAHYLNALEGVLADIMAVGPQWLVLSLGFDTYQHDPLSSFALSTAAFGQMGGLLRQLGLPLVIVQEGGYALPHLEELAHTFISGLLEGDPDAAPTD